MTWWQYQQVCYRQQKARQNRPETNTLPVNCIIIFVLCHITQNKSLQKNDEKTAA
jgi:hypothetical protein